jgi:PadR family transcriptional regulator AphA
MSLSHALLGLLAMAPGSGYELAKEFECELGRYAWQAGHTSIYPELAKLAERGLVVASDTGARGRRTYEITDAGRAELRDWLMTPTGSAVVRNESVLRLFLVSALPPEDARELLKRIAAHTAEEAAELRRLLAEPDVPAPGRRRVGYGRLAGEYGVRQFDAVHDWAQWALDQLDREQSGQAQQT